MIKVYLDDLRIPPHGYTLVKNARTAIDFITSSWDMIEEISLDHDLGDEETCGNGYQVVCEMEDFVYNTRPTHLPYIHVHSANPIGRRRMEFGIKNIERMIKDS